MVRLFELLICIEILTYGSLEKYLWEFSASFMDELYEKFFYVLICNWLKVCLNTLKYLRLTSLGFTFDGRSVLSTYSLFFSAYQEV